MPRVKYVNSCAASGRALEMNAPRPHDLLWGMPVSVLPTDAPQWALEVLASGQPVVVRRATCEAGWVAVGLRGHDRAQRLGALMRLTDI